MRKLFTLILLTLMAFGVAACGSTTAEDGIITPSADAPRLTPDYYLENVASTEHILVDVRTDDEVERGVIPGAIHIPLDELANRTSELPQDATIVVYCNSGNRSRSAAQILKDAGYENLLDLTGIQQWVGAGNELVPLDQ